MSSTPPNTLRAIEGASVILPCEPDQFREFIAGLLGKPQTITRVVDGPFEVTREDVESLFHLVKQRLTSQNDAQMIQFTARVIYDDNSSVLLASLEELLNYSEVKPLVSVGLALSWTLLVKFQNKPFPERQQIDVRFIADGGRMTIRRNGLRTNIVDEIIPSFSDFMDIRISHTDRTWATDIDALISGHLGLLRKELFGLKRITTRFAAWLGWLTFGVALAISGFGGIKIAAKLSADSLSAVKQALGGSAVTLDRLGHKIDVLAQVIATGTWERLSLYSLGYTVLALAVSIALGIFVGTSADFSRPSFVLLTRSATQKRKAVLESLDGGMRKVIFGVVGSILLSLLGSYLFSVLVDTLGVAVGQN